MMTTIMIVMMVVILMKWVIYGDRENYGFQEKTEFQSNSKSTQQGVFFVISITYK